MRAYVGVERISLSGADYAFDVKCTIAIKNYGQTPASTLVVGLEVIGAERDDENPAIIPVADPAQDSLMPGAVVVLTFPRSGQSARELSEHLRNGRLIWAGGSIEYVDIFGRQQTTDACMFAPEGEVAFVCAPTGNRAT